MSMLPPHRTIEPISSFKQALVYLGEDKIKIFVSAVATAHAAIDKPRELYSPVAATGLHV